MVVAAHPDRGCRYQLAYPTCRLAHHLRVERRLLDPDAGNPARAMAPAPALGHGRHADDAGFLRTNHSGTLAWSAPGLLRVSDQRRLVLSDCGEPYVRPAASDRTSDPS